MNQIRKQIHLPIFFSREIKTHILISPKFSCGQTTCYFLLYRFILHHPLLCYMHLSPTSNILVAFGILNYVPCTAITLALTYSL